MKNHHYAALNSILVSLLFFFNGCSKEKQITASVVLTEQSGQQKSSGMIGVRIVSQAVLEGLAVNYLKLNQRIVSDQTLITNLERQLEQLSDSNTNIVIINQLLLECRIRQHESQATITQAIDEFLHGLPPMVSKTTIDKSFNVVVSEKDWLIVELFREKNQSNQINKKPFEIWMIKAADCRNSVVVGDESIIDSTSKASQAIDKIVSKNQRFDASPDLIAWATDVRIRATRAKEAWESEFRAKIWNDGLVRIRSKGLKSGDRYTLPNQLPEIVVRAISVGDFLMGSPLDEQQRSADEIQHKVTLTQDFFVFENECTQKQWQAVMTNNPSFFKAELNPVEQVSWDDAVRYCGILTAKHRKLGIISGELEWRLPSEAEWEFACRAGQARDDNGNLSSVAVYSKNSGLKVNNVATKQANPWGLVDIKGNVWEWCSDWYAPYSSADAVNPQGIQMSTGRVLRGGGWLLGAEFCRAASRRSSAPHLRYSYVGFRPVLSVKRER